MDRSEMMNHFIEIIMNKIEKKKAVDINKLGENSEKIVKHKINRLTMNRLTNWIEVARTLKTDEIDEENLAYAKWLAEQGDLLESVGDHNYHIIQSLIDIEESTRKFGKLSITTDVTTEDDLANTIFISLSDLDDSLNE
jgi:RIO-like serine/threonine protein kinase